MTPLNVTGILFLLQSGYPAQVVMRVCVNTINGLENSYSGPGSPRVGIAQFRDLLVAMREAQTAGGMGMQIKEVNKEEAAVMFLRPLEDETVAAANRRITALLGLNVQSREFKVVYGRFPPVIPRLRSSAARCYRSWSISRPISGCHPPMPPTGGCMHRSAAPSRNACFRRYSKSATARSSRRTRS